MGGKKNILIRIIIKRMVNVKVILYYLYDQIINFISHQNDYLVSEFSQIKIKKIIIKMYKFKFYLIIKYKKYLPKSNI